MKEADWLQQHELVELERQKLLLRWNLGEVGTLWVNQTSATSMASYEIHREAENILK